MGRTVEINGGANYIDGPVEILEVHGGVVNISGRVGACNHFGGVVNGSIGKQNVEVVYRHKERVVYRDRIIEKPKIVYRDAEVTDDVLMDRITRLEAELEAERKAHKQEVMELNDRLDGALEAYHNLLHQKADDRKPYRTWDDYRPTKQECEAVYKNLKVWLECEQELEPINL